MEILNTLYIANFEDIMGIGIGALAMMIPIVAILSHHQQKMAMIMRDNHLAQGNSDEVRVLRDEVVNLRQQMNQFALALDDLKSLPRPTGAGSDQSGTGS